MWRTATYDTEKGECVRVTTAAAIRISAHINMTSPAAQGFMSNWSGTSYALPMTVEQRGSPTREPSAAAVGQRQGGLTESRERTDQLQLMSLQRGCGRPCRMASQTSDLSMLEARVCSEGRWGRRHEEVRCMPRARCQGSACEHHYQWNVGPVVRQRRQGKALLRGPRSHPKPHSQPSEHPIGA